MDHARPRPRTRTAILWLVGAMLAATGAASFLSGQTPAGRGRAEERLFEEVAAAINLRFHHRTGATGEFYLPEIMGAGVALFDFDRDGDLDLYLIQGRRLAPSPGARESFPPPPGGWSAGNRLYRNELIPSGTLHLTDVTKASGAGIEHYGMGAATGDYDADGNVDLYVTGFDRHVLLRNNGAHQKSRLSAAVKKAVEPAAKA